MITKVIAAVFAIVALSASAANAQSGLPGIQGFPRGSVGCQYLASPPTLLNGSASPLQCDNKGIQLHDLSSLAGTSLGAPSLFGTTPGSVNVIGVNAAIIGTVSSVQSGNWLARLVGNAGAVMDFAGQNASSPANSLLTGCQFNTSPTTITSTNSSPLQCDNGGNIKVNPGTPGTWGFVAVGGAAAPTNAMVAGGIYNTTLPTITATNGAAFQVDGFARIIGAPKTILSGTLVKGTTAAMTGTTSTQVIAAVTSQRIYPTHISCVNSSATATLVSIQDGSGGTTLLTLIAPAGGGEVIAPGLEPITWTTAGNALYAADVTTGASVICSASGHSSAN